MTHRRSKTECRDHNSNIHLHKSHAQARLEMDSWNLTTLLTLRAHRNQKHMATSPCAQYVSPQFCSHVETCSHQLTAPKLRKHPKHMAASSCAQYVSPNSAVTSNTFCNHVETCSHQHTVRKPIHVRSGHDKLHTQCMTTSMREHSTQTQRTANNTAVIFGSDWTHKP